MSIYVLRSVNLIKIGYSENLRSRFSGIVSSAPVPVEFVGHMPGDREMEAHLHQRFESRRFAGEWFVETPEIRAAFDAILTPGLPPIENAPSVKRKADAAVSSALSERFRAAAKVKWPDLKVGARIEALIADIGWNPARVRDLYYCHPRMALRAFELEEFETWVLPLERAFMGALAGAGTRE